MAHYGELLISDNDIQYDIAKTKLYNEIVKYFENPILTKIKNIENFSMYMCKISCLLTNYYRYLIILIEKDSNEINTRIYLENLKWKILQTRTLSDKHDLKTHSYTSGNRGLLNGEIFKKETKKNMSIYDCNDYPIKITLLHTKKDSNFEYNDKGTLLSSLETYQTIVDFI
tara:strand:+ start:10214 stop:10726 length:513 start_codon:yes stop_codon:yes gene_type:complete